MMEETIKNWAVGVATAMSISAMGIVGNLYVDVQVLKNTQAQNKVYMDQQESMITNIKDLVIKMDKSIAIQAETMKALTSTVNDLKDARYKK